MMGFAEGVLTVSLKTVHSFQWLRYSITYFFTWLWTAILYTVKHKGTKLESIQEDTKHLQKVPLHLAVIVQEEELSYDDLACVVVWAFAVGIHYVSLYDPHGNLPLIIQGSSQILLWGHNILEGIFRGRI